MSKKSDADTYMHTDIYIHKYIYMYIYTCVCVCVCLCVCVRLLCGAVSCRVSRVVARYFLFVVRQ